MLNSIKALIAGKRVFFAYYRDNALWYRTEDGFIFPIPINDTGSATFPAEDKAILYMRWIRAYLNDIKAAL